MKMITIMTMSMDAREAVTPAAAAAAGRLRTRKHSLSALLGYMLNHNESHARELDEMAGKIAEAGMPEAAEQIRKGVAEFQKGNLYLSLALSMVKEDK
ncbi:MAG: hypothetical protein ACLR6B_09925 [Blautia sp.]